MISVKLNVLQVVKLGELSRFFASADVFSDSLRYTFLQVMALLILYAVDDGNASEYAEFTEHTGTC